MILVDANLLIYAVDADSHHHERARRWLGLETGEIRTAKVFLTPDSLAAGERQRLAEEGLRDALVDLGHLLVLGAFLHGEEVGVADNAVRPAQELGLLGREVGGACRWARKLEAQS